MEKPPINIDYPKAPKELSVETLHQMAAAYISKFGDPTIPKEPRKHKWYDKCCYHKPDEVLIAQVKWLKEITPETFNLKDAWYELAEIFKHGYKDVDIVYHPPFLKQSGFFAQGPIYVHHTTLLAGMAEECFKKAYHDVFDGPGGAAYRQMLGYVRTTFPDALAYTKDLSA